VAGVGSQPSCDSFANGFSSDPESLWRSKRTRIDFTRRKFVGLGLPLMTASLKPSAFAQIENWTAQLSPIKPLLGKWTGEGKGSHGPFRIDAEFDERGRWILLRHAISPPSGSPFYVSTQVYGFDDKGLTLDYFDTAGSFNFRGSRTGDHIHYKWTAAAGANSKDLWKTSDYWFEGNSIRFRYESYETDANGGKPASHIFEGVLHR
jgi:hypothetical protein